MEHPQIETGPEHSCWHRAFHLLKVSGLMAIQHDWWLPASCYHCGWKGCLPLKDRKLSWATHRAISCDLLIIFFPKDSQVAEEHRPLGKNLSLCIHLFIDQIQVGQTRKMVFGAKLAIEHVIWGVFFASKWFLLWPVENICFFQEISLTFIIPTWPGTEIFLCISHGCCGATYKCECPCASWRAMVQKEKKPSGSHWLAEMIRTLSKRGCPVYRESRFWVSSLYSNSLVRVDANSPAKEWSCF